MKYEEIKKERQKEFDALPLHFAFSHRQFEEEMKACGLTVNDADKVYSIGHNGFILKEDVHLLKAWLEKPNPIPELMKDKDFAIDAFYYEMCNHEYMINPQRDFDVCSCFGDIKYGGCMAFYDEYLKQMGFSDDIVDAYKIAKEKYYKAAEENGWG